MAKITLTIKDGNKKESQQFEIDRVTTQQMLNLKKEIGKITKELKGNGELGSVIQDLFGGELQPGPETGDAKEQALEKMKDDRFVNGMASAFDKLLDVLPDRAFNILSILSGIDAETLKQGYFDELFDVYDAIMEENDVQKIVDRIKTSFSQTKEQWGGLIRNLLDKKK